MAPYVADLEADVLIVGGGPVGLTAALLLRRHGVSSIVVERRPHRTHAPKAHVLNPRSLEILHAAGMDVDALRAQATNADDDKVARFVTQVQGRQLGSMPFEAQDDTYTPFPRINLAQPKLEKILRHKLATEPEVSILEGHQWTGYEQDADNVLSTVQTEAGVRRIRSRYLIGADGANSPVRAAAGIGMTGQQDVAPCLTISFEANWRDMLADRPAMFYWVCGREVPGVFLAYDIGSTWTYLVLNAPATPPNADQARRIILDAVGGPVDFTLKYVLPWGLTAQIAERYRDGRVLLAGDSAHRFPPTGGLGLNTGIQDVHNLAWKLAAVLSGRGPASLLDSYDAERRPVAQLNADQSMANAGDVIAVLTLSPEAPQDVVDQTIAKSWDAFNSLGLQLGFSYGPDPAPRTVSSFTPTGRPGDRMPHAWIGTGDRRRSALDLLDERRYTLLAEDVRPWNKAASDAGVALVGLDSVDIPRDWVELVGITERSALLVRPDGHIAAVLSSPASADSEALLDLLYRPLASTADPPS